MKTHTREEAAQLGLREFHSTRPCPQGHTLRLLSTRGCIECRRGYWREWYYKHGSKPAAKAARRQRQLEANRADPRATMLGRARQRAKRAGVTFALQPADVIVPKLCPILGIALRVGAGRSGASSPSLDRIRPHLGYVRGNVAVISQKANQIKNEATVDELRAVLEWLEAQP